MREILLKNQPTWGLRRAQGTGQKSATPATLTKVILVLLTMLLLPSAAWADYTYGGQALTYQDGTEGYRYYHNGYQNKWYVSMTGAGYYNDGAFGNFDELKLTYERPLAGTLSDTYDYSAAVVLAGNVSDDNVVNIKVYRLATQNSASGTLIGSIHYIQNPDSNPTTYSYSYTPEKDNEEKVVSQEFNNEFIQLAFEHQGGNDVESTLSTDAITSITLNFSGTSYGLRIGNYRVTDANANDIMGDGTASYDNGVLTLNDAEIGGCIYTSNALTIDLKGTNYIYATDSCAIKNTNSTGAVDLTFKSTDGTGNLTMWGNYSCTEGFSNPSYNGIKGLAGLKRTFIAPQILSGGDGTSGSPFEIATKEKFIEFANYVNDGYTSSSQYFKLTNTNDIEFSTTDEFEPIGNGTYKFSGTFNGNDKTIKNLTLHGQGLFTTIEGGSVTKLTLSNYNLTGVAGSYVTGGITGELKDGGSITYCKIIDSSIACPSNEYNPDVAGIVSRQESGTTISNCIVDNTTIKAISSINESGPEQHAGGIVARTYDGATISSCQVINGTEIQNYNENMNVSCLYAGAIVGNNAGTLSSNTYDYSVQVKTKGLYESEVREKTLKEYTHRGSDAETDPSGISLYTQLVALPKSVTGGTITGADGTYYKSTDEGIYVVPGKTATLNATPTADTSFEISWLQAVNATTTDVITPDSTSIDGGGRKYEFEMPDAQVNVTAKFAIDLAAEGITATIANAICTGEAIEPTTIAVEGIANVASLTKDTDFTITGYTKGGEAVTSPIDVGTYTVSIKGKGDYTGTKDVSYTIEKGIAGLYFYHIKGDQEDPVLAVEEATYGTAYDSPRLKNPHNLPITFSCKAENSETGAESDVATIDDEGNVTILKAGTVYVYAVAAENDNYDELDVHYQLNIDKADLDIVTIEAIADQTYTGSEITPEITVKLNGNTLSASDYGFSIGYSNNINVATSTSANAPTVTITATEGSNYFTAGTTQMAYFNIVQKSLTDESISVTVSATSLTYNGDLQYPVITVKDGETTLTSEAYGYYYSQDGETVDGPASVGTYTLTISGKGNYTGEITREITITPKEVATTDITVTLATTSYTYDGTAHTPGVSSVSITEDDESITLGTEDYDTDDIGYTNNVNAALATATENAPTVTVSLKGNYSGTGVATFTIEQADLSGYVVTGLTTPTSYTGSPITPTFSVKATEEAETSLTANTDYSVKYQQAGADVDEMKDAGAYKIIISGEGNYKGSKSVDFTIERAQLQELTINLEGWTYGDTPNVPSLDGNLDEGDITWEYKAAGAEAYSAWSTLTTTTDAGTYMVKATVAETDNYEGGSKEAEFVIEQLDISQADITLENNELTYNGEQQTVNVKKVMAGNIEVPIDCYEVSGDTEKEAGDYKLTVTAKTKDSQGNAIKNNFTGSAEKDWKIKNRTVTTDELGLSENQSQATYYSETEDLEVPEGVVAYIITGVNGNNVVTQRIRYIPKRVAVFVEQTTSTENPLEVIPDASELPLKGTAVDLNVASISGGTVYVLYKGEFVKSTTGTIPAKRCYLLLPNNVAAGTRAFGITGGGSDGSTAIKSINDEPSTIDNWYDMRGRRIEKPTKGLYILNGKKVVIK